MTYCIMSNRDESEKRKVNVKIYNRVLKSSLNESIRNMAAF